VVAVAMGLYSWVVVSRGLALLQLKSMVYVVIRCIAGHI
jgi:hypothetical protein